MNNEKYLALLVDGHADGTQLATASSDLVNRLVVDEAAIVAAICADDVAKGRFGSMSFAWLVQLYDMFEAMDYDDRNEAAAQIGYLLCDNITILAPSLFSLATVPTWSLVFATCMSRKHRTLQQSFSAIVFRFLAAVMRDTELSQVDAFMARSGFPHGGWRTTLPFV